MSKPLSITDSTGKNHTLRSLGELSAAEVQSFVQHAQILQRLVTGINSQALDPALVQAGMVAMDKMLAILAPTLSAVETAALDHNVKADAIIAWRNQYPVPQAFTPPAA